MINAITAAINAATDRGDENYAAVAASRKQGCATPHWMTCDDLRAVLKESEDWTLVEDEIELADVISDALDLGVNADDVKEWTAIVKVHSGEYVTPSDPREYIVVWSYDADIITVDTLLAWGDDYDGELDELDPDDYDDDDALEAADDERRRQYWRLTGHVATSQEAWLRAVESTGADADEAKAVADRFAALCPGYWPIDCYLAYERGDGHMDALDTIEGAGHYGIRA